LLKNVGKIPYSIKDENDTNVVIDKLDTIVPILRTSAVTLEGYDILTKFLLSFPERRKNFDKPFLMFVDKIYNVSSVGTVVSGTIKQDKLKAGKELLFGIFFFPLIYGEDIFCQCETEGKPPCRWNCTDCLKLLNLLHLLIYYAKRSCQRFSL
jgi:hypothetical protein